MRQCASTRYLGIGRCEKGKSKDRESIAKYPKIRISYNSTDVH